MKRTDAPHSPTLDELVHAELSKMSMGLSPISLALAYADWAMHLSASPGKQLALAQLANKLCQDTVAQQANISPEASPYAKDARFDSNARRNANRNDLQTIILDTFAALTAAQVIERLDVAQIANARMNTMAELWAHPQLKARERWTSVDSPAGELPALLPPGKQSAFDYRMGAIPKVGEHTDAILKELGVQR